jgi:hypothetical protein
VFSKNETTRSWKVVVPLRERERERDVCVQIEDTVKSMRVRWSVNDEHDPHLMPCASLMGFSFLYIFTCINLLITSSLC